MDRNDHPSSPPKENDARHPFAARLNSSWPDPRLAKIIARHLDQAFPSFSAEIRMDLAHTIMLGEQGILKPDEVRDILRVLQAIEAEAVQGLYVGSKSSTLFWHIEDALIQKLGPALGGKMHTGRSHNDMMPTLDRIKARDAIVEVMKGVLGFRRALLDRATEHVETIMPGYSAVQQAQPWTFGHYLIGVEAAASRDFERFEQTFRRTNLSPLGTAALAGSAWPLDRARTAELLGFDSILLHSKDAGFGTKDYVAELFAIIAILMSTLNAVASDLTLWTTSEFAMISLADDFCGTSSIMPQKKNAWALDWTRGAAGQAIGHFGACLATLRGTTSTDGSSQGYPNRSVGSTYDEAGDHLSLMTGVVETLTVHEERMKTRAEASWATASELADTIVRAKGLSFRTAHSIVGRLVRTLDNLGLAPADVTTERLDAAALEIIGQTLSLSDKAIRNALDPSLFIRSRTTPGSVHPDETRSMIEDARAQWAEDSVTVGAIEDRLSGAARTLQAAIEEQVR